MRWLLVLAAVTRLSAQVCGIIPTPNRYDGSNGSSTIPGSGGTYTISVDTGVTANCPWTVSVSSNTPWITLGQTSGNGPVSFTWTAAPNPSTIQRSGAIFMSGGWVIPVVQLGGVCIATLPATSASAVVGGGPGSFAVQTSCQWYAVSNNSSWITLQAAPTNGTGAGSVNYTVGANGCVAGRTGSITVEAGTLSSNASDSPAPFTINQDGSSDNLTLAPTTNTVSAAAGSGRISLTTGAGCAWRAFTDAENWLQIVLGASGSGSSTISYNVLANTSGSPRSGHINVGTQAVFTLTQLAAAAPVPQLTVVVNAASYAGGPIAPGEVVALGGTGLGPSKGVGTQLAANGQSITTTLGGVQVLFDGTYPVALTYVSANQINAVAPYEIAGEATTQIQVQYQGGTSAALQAQVQAAAPGIFTSNANGLGNGAILNQNYSLNGTSNPAPRGSTVMIFCTGAGVTDPPGTDAAITTGTPAVVQPVSVTIGGIPVPSQQVTYAGGAPGAVAGLTQINAVVPLGAPTGANVPVVIQIGTWQSQTGVTMVVD